MVISAGYAFSPHGTIDAEIKKQGREGFRHITNYFVLDELVKHFGEVHVFSTDVKDFTNILPDGCIHHYNQSPVRGIKRSEFEELGIDMFWVGSGPQLPYIRNAPGSVWVHLSYENMWWNTSNNPVKRILFKQFEKYLHRRVNSTGIATNEIAKTFPHLENRVVDYRKGVDTEFFNSSSTGKKRGDTPVISWVGRIHSVKNPLRMIRVFEIVSKKMPEAVLEMIGDGPLLNECMEASEKAGINVVFHKQLDLNGVRDVLARSWCYMLTSDYDASPKSVIEAVSMCVPVISTNVGGVSDFMYDMKGLLCDTENELSSKLLKVLNEPGHYFNIAEKACKKIHDKHDLRKNIRNTIDEIKRRMMP